MSTIAIVCEAPADRQTVVAILECMLSTHVDWYVPDSGFATFRGYLPTDPQLLWQDTKHVAGRFPLLNLKGFRRDKSATHEPLSHDYRNAKLALLLFARRMLEHDEPIDAVILLKPISKPILT